MSQLLQITEGERNHELLLSVKNLQELGSSPILYIVPVLPSPLPSKLVTGKHFVLADLLKLLPRISSQVESVSRLETPRSSKSFSLGCARSQACPLGEGEKKEEDEGRAGKGYRLGIKGVCGLEEFGS